MLVATLGPPQPGGWSSRQLRWSAPAECPEQAVVRARVERKLADDSGRRFEPTELRMTVERTDTGYRLVAELRDQGGPIGERILEASTCDELTEAAIAIAAIASDPSLLTVGEDVPPPAESSHPSVAEQDPPQPPPPDPQPVAAAPAIRRDRNQVLDLGAGVGVGRLAKGPMALLRIGYGLERDRFRGLVRLSAMGPSVGGLEGRRGRGIFGAGLVGIAGCGRTRTTPWSFVGCLATDVGIAGGHGQRLDRPRGDVSLWWGLEAEAGVEYAWAPDWSLALRADAGVAPLRTRFVIDEQGTACCERWGVGLRVGVLKRFDAP